MRSSKQILQLQAVRRFCHLQQSMRLPGKCSLLLLLLLLLGCFMNASKAFITSTCVSAVAPTPAPPTYVAEPDNNQCARQGKWSLLLLLGAL
jgi:hypothetical protein